MTNYVYAIGTLNHGIIDVSKSEKGAKQCATRRKYDHVYRRDVKTGHIITIWRKSCGKWSII